MTTEQRITKQEKRVAECQDYLQKARKFYELCRKKALEEKAVLQEMKAQQIYST